MIYRFFNLKYIFLLGLIMALSCKSSKKINNLNHCNILIQELQLCDNQEIKTWLNKNSIECSKVLEFVNNENKNKEVKEYCVQMIKTKILDEEFKIERLIEFYYLLNSSDDPFNLDKN